MSRQSYKKFLQVLEVWPVDQGKVGGRDLGEYLRFRIQRTYNSGDLTAVNEEKCLAVSDSLMRIAKDTHKNSFPRKFNSSALGAPKESCTAAITNDALEQLRQENLPLKEKIKEYFKRK